MCKHVICEQLWIYHISYVKVIHAIDARMPLSTNYLPQYMHPTHTHTHTQPRDSQPTQRQLWPLVMPQLLTHTLPCGCRDHLNYAHT